MKIEMDGDQPVIDARDLGALLDLDPSEVQSLMRAGQITTRHEIGVGEDAGRFRVTFIHAGLRVRLTCTEDGDVVSTIRVRQGTT